MSESKAAEDYKVFESLRNRFSDANSNPSPSRSEPRKAGKRRFDPRANAPPLVPLVEEGDQPQPSTSVSPIKGKWKHSNQNKSNHLNGPDFDALETSSTASLSSAYSEPGNFSPILGSSLSELSDAGSCETFSEYDIKMSKQSRISSLKTSFERNSSIEISPSQRSSKQVGRPPDADVPENFVSNNKKAWDNAIGDWVFSGIPHTPVSPSKPKMRPPSSEVRVPTPLSTPLGSTDNLLMDSESRSSILSNNESNVSDDYQNFNRKPFLGRVLNKPPSRPSSASCVPTDTKRKQLILAETDDRSSSETNLTLEQSSRDDEVYKTDSDKTQNSSTVGSGSEEEEKREDDIPSLPTQYKFGKFVSISDTMLPTEERDHEYIAEGPTTPPPSAPSDLEKPVKPVQLEEQVVESVAQNVNDGKVEEEPSEDETPVQYEPGKFVSQITSLSAPDQEETEAGEKAENVVPHTPVVTNPVSEHVPNTAEAKQESSKQEGTPPSNRWFDAYMKCKASQAKQKKPPPVAAKKTTATKPPVKKPELKELPIKEQPMATAPDPGMVEKDDFEKVQKITPSKSYKWLEAMQKYKALKTDTEQKCESKSVQVADEWSQGPKTAVSTPKKSSEEPTFSTLSQRAQVFGGMRKKPPLRRAKSFQVGGDNASPLATGLTRPTKVLKKQMTASFT